MRDLPLLFLLVGRILASDPIPLTFDPRHAHDLEFRDIGGNITELTTTGADPYIQLAPFPNPTTQTIVAFGYFSPQGIDGLTVFHGPPISGKRQFDAGSLSVAEAWVPKTIDLRDLSSGKWNPAYNLLRLDFGGESGRTVRIRDLQLRDAGPAELRSAAERKADRRDKLEAERRINAFYHSDFPDRIDAVVIDAEMVRITGALATTEKPRHLIELRPEISLGAHASLDGDRFILEARAGVIDTGPLDGPASLNRPLPRHLPGTDRTTSRWATAEPLADGRWKLRSAWRYATDLSRAAANDLPRLVPAGIKGMGGVSPHLPLEELVELGVRNITINLDITRLLSTEPRAGWEPFQHAGRTWFADPGRTAGWDRLTAFAAEHDIITSGILLVNFADTDYAKLLIHPEADRAGQYAMPDFTSKEGVAAYEAAVGYLAGRYSRPGRGRIANWIIHNEIGYGWVWTNMGSQPPMLYMDTYLRSMRLVHNVARRHDPTARVFISLTHHWNTPTDPSWKSYSNRDLMDRLVESSRIEGDFAWGVAYHPYPENLFQPDAWNDTNVTEDFDTPLITPKNIAVLDRLMRRPEMLDSSGRPRGVLLSEQGFNTRDYSEESQRLQAAAFVHMWRQLRGLGSIEAFHNHRWVDHAGEGGLLLGLRTLAEKGRPYGDRKFAWDIYKALDTPAEAAASRFADAILPSSTGP